MNHRTMFATYPMGFAKYGQWSEYVHDMWDKYDLGCERFGEEWLRRWESLKTLLMSQCRVEYHNGNSWRDSRLFDRCTVAYCLLKVASKETRATRRRIVLPNGKVAKVFARK